MSDPTIEVTKRTKRSAPNLRLRALELAVQLVVGGDQTFEVGQHDDAVVTLAGKLYGFLTKESA